MTSGHASSFRRAGLALLPPNCPKLLASFVFPSYAACFVVPCHFYLSPWRATLPPPSRLPSTPPPPLPSASTLGSRAVFLVRASRITRVRWTCSTEGASSDSSGQRRFEYSGGKIGTKMFEGMVWPGLQMFQGLTINALFRFWHFFVVGQWTNAADSGKFLLKCLRAWLHWVWECLGVGQTSNDSRSKQCKNHETPSIDILRQFNEFKFFW